MATSTVAPVVQREPSPTVLPAGARNRQEFGPANFVAGTDIAGFIDDFTDYAKVMGFTDEMMVRALPNSAANNKNMCKQL